MLSNVKSINFGNFWKKSNSLLSSQITTKNWVQKWSLFQSYRLLCKKDFFTYIWCARNFIQEWTEAEFFATLDTFVTLRITQTWATIRVNITKWIFDFHYREKKKIQFNALNDHQASSHFIKNFALFSFQTLLAQVPL